MPRAILLSAIACLLVLAAVPAEAGFIIGSIEVDRPDGLPMPVPPPWAHAPEWVFDHVGGLVPTLTLREEFVALGLMPVLVSGETDEDPIMHVSKEVENSSGVTWDAYRITLSGLYVTFWGTATSSHFQSATVTATEIYFSAPDPVPSGETVTLDFDVLVWKNGLFNFTLTQEPVPEPATLAFLAVGVSGLMLMRRRRRGA